MEGFASICDHACYVALPGTKLNEETCATLSEGKHLQRPNISGEGGGRGPLSCRPVYKLSSFWRHNKNISALHFLRNSQMGPIS
jgi:hypothetical protein